MKAAYIERHGGPEVLQYGDLPDPVAGPGEVVIDIVAASVNGADWKVRSGSYSQAKFPYVLGRDFSGVVSALGAGVTDLRAGDEVFGVCDAGQEGAYAEKIAVKAAIIAKKPAGLSHINAAALALTGLTALCTVEDTLKLKRGETILIQGGAGGVASFAIQVAKHIGARVITTTSAANIDYVRGLGADEVDRLQRARFYAGGVKTAMRCSIRSAARWRRNASRCSSRAAAPPSSLPGTQAPKSPRSDVTSLRPAVGRDRAHMERIAELYLAGAVRPPQIKLYRLVAGGRGAPCERGPPLPRQARLSDKVRPSASGRRGGFQTRPYASRVGYCEEKSSRSGEHSGAVRIRGEGVIVGGKSPRQHPVTGRRGRPQCRIVPVIIEVPAVASRRPDRPLHSLLQLVIEPALHVAAQVHHRASALLQPAQAFHDVVDLRLDHEVQRNCAPRTYSARRA